MHKLVLEQRKQKHPDCYYLYKLTDNGIGQRFYDIKAGQFTIDSGNIYCMSNLVEFEKKVGHHLHAQYQLYKKYKPIKGYLEDLIQNKKLSWSERNILFQNYIKDHLHEFAEINPSFILYNPLFYEIDKESIPKNLRGLITESSLENIENTQMVLANAIVVGGKTCQENYMNHPYKCPIIVGFIKELLGNILDS